VLVLPGALVAWALRLRGLALWVAGPALSFVVSGAAGMWLRHLGVPWGVPTALVVFGLVAAAGYLATSRWVPDRQQVVRVPLGPLWALAGPVAGSLLALVVVGHGMGWDLDAVNQSWDPPWHANLVAYIADTGVGDWTASRYNQLGWGGQFYPTGLHVVEALAVDLTGQDASRTFNVFFALAAVVLPWGVFLLARVVSPTWPLAAAITGVVAVLPPDHPWAQLGTQAWAWSMTVVPVAVALTMVACTRADWLGVPVAALTIASTLALQPAGLASTLVLVACWLLAGPSGWRPRVTAAARLAAAGAATGLLLFPEISRAAGQSTPWRRSSPH
jgi:hypothetical protein